MPPILHLQSVSKSFHLHHQHDAHLPVLHNVTFDIAPGECVVLDGPSGMGKSTLLKLVYANYRASSGSICIRQNDAQMLDITQANSRELLDLRAHTVAYVSQFLRVIPRVAAIDIVMEPLLGHGHNNAAQRDAAREAAATLLTRLRIPERLWALPPATFSGGEQQRINIARSFIRRRPLMLLDEPSASLDAANTQTVVELTREAVAAGSAVLGIFHDAKVRDAVATRRIDVAQFKPSPAKTQH